MPPLTLYAPAVKPMSDRIRSLEDLLKLVESVPEGWLMKTAKKERGGGDSGLECRECLRYDVLVNAWRKALKWTDGLDCTLSVMLAVAHSTKFVGEQLWTKVIGPPSSGKTTLLEGLSVCKQHVYSRDSIRGFHDGWKDDEGVDLSLTALIDGKTLATKDGDTLLKSPDLPRVLSEARALYDGVSRTHYRNHKMSEHEGHRMTWLLCGTAALREIDDSELGARFLDCVVMDKIDDEHEDDVGWRAANAEDRNMLIESNGRPDSKHAPELTEAMALTGGYVKFLRDNAVDLSSQVVLSEDAKQHCTRMGKFIAFMRARKSRREDAEATREFSARLIKQLVRMTRSLSVALNRNTADVEVMRRVRKVTLDTARGRTLAIAAHLFDAEVGMESRMISLKLGEPPDKVGSYLRFLRKIGVVESFDDEAKSKTGTVLKLRTLWRLTIRVRNLYARVVVGEDE